MGILPMSDHLNQTTGKMLMPRRTSHSNATPLLRSSRREMPVPADRAAVRLALALGAGDQRRIKGIALAWISTGNHSPKRKPPGSGCEVGAEPI